jgi:tetratricopeptide (TPR) repeat protein
LAGSFAQRHWSDFERLAFELTKDCFSVVPTKVLRTQESKDGGFDSMFVHELGKLKETLIAHETLMEAKLRSSKESLGLRAFAATMVIAFNGATQCLVVVTNRQYSPQALTAARDFEWRARLKVILVDQKTLSAWVRPRLEQLSSSYPRELLDDLLLKDPNDESYEEIEIPGRDLEGAEPPARIAFGRLDQSALAKCEIVFGTPYEVVPAAEAQLTSRIVGQSRRKVARNLATVLGDVAGCAIVAGEAGVGKSFVIREVIASLPASRRCIGIVDLSQTGTSRQLFLTAIARITGLEIAEAVREFTTPDAKRFFSKAGGVPIPQEVCDAVLSVLAATNSTVFARPDIDQLQLTSYLSFVANDGRGGARLLIFQNLDKASEEVLEFLHAIVPMLVAGDISVLLEIAVGGAVELFGPSRWKAYLDLFERSATLGRFAIENLTKSDAIDLLLEELPGLGAERAQFIYERVGNLPLFLHHSALWLKTHRVVAERAHRSHLIEDPEVFFEGLRPETCVSILDRHIDLWRHEFDLPYADAITAATLLNGRVPANALRLLLPKGTSVEGTLDALIATGLFISEPRVAGVRVSHSLLLERMRAIESGQVPGYAGRKFERKRVATNLLEGIDSYASTTVGRDLFSTALYAVCERWQESWECAQRAGQSLMKENQLAAAADAFRGGVEAADNMVGLGESLGANRRIDSLIEFLQVEDQRYRLALDQNSARLTTLAVSLRTTQLPAEESRNSIWIRSHYLLWRSEFTRERFTEALAIARELFERISQPDDIDPELAGHAIAALGITLKALEQTDESLQVFDRGIALFPNSAYCRMERLSNLAALSLRSDPSQALSHYRRILTELGDVLPIRERLHIGGDLAMALFLSNRWQEAQAQATQAVNMADANGVPAQAARGRNILGCVLWAEGDAGDAMALFDRAILDAERSYMERFLWRFRVNLASAASEVGELSTAMANARWAEERLMKARASHLQELASSPTHVTSRWYVALLAIALTYHRCGAAEDEARLTRMAAELPNFDQHLQELVRGDFPKQVFDGTTHRQGDRVMITG